MNWFVHYKITHFYTLISLRFHYYRSQICRSDRVIFFLEKESIARCRRKFSKDRSRWWSARKFSCGSFFIFKEAVRESKQILSAN